VNDNSIFTVLMYGSMDGRLREIVKDLVRMIDSNWIVLSVFSKTPVVLMVWRR